jgi:putative nucleotidyltransferase with HDIG domain
MEGAMDTACDGCQNKHKGHNHRLSGSTNHVCQCRSRDENIKIDPESDQGAVTPGDVLKASTGKQRSDSAQYQQGLKSRIIKNINDLPPMPQVVIKITQLISDLNSEITDLAQILESDQAVAAKVLKMANSAYYGMSGKISSIHQASVLLGYQTLGEIVSMAGTVGILSRSMPGYGYDARELWKHSLAVAFSAKMIAERKNKDLIYEAHTAGLIHDVGKIILDGYILEHMDRISVYMMQGENSFLDAERHVFGFDHAEIASEVCRKWKIPDQISLAIGCHHQPSVSNGDELSYILHMADHIAAKSGISYDEDDAFRELESGTVDFIGFRREEIKGIVMRVLEAVEQL